MARYQVPPDPRKSDNDDSRRPRRLRRDGGEPIPWLWLGLGGVVTALAIGVAFLVANAFLSPPPLSPAALPEPTLLRLTAPPSPTATATRPFPTPTTIPTFTPAPTPDIYTPPQQVAVGYYASVSGTGGVGVTVRGGPSTNNVALTVAEEGGLLRVIGGPEAGEGADLWWEVRLSNGTEGWVAGDFLTPAAPTRIP
jgi:hypothetical protein